MCLVYREQTDTIFNIEQKLPEQTVYYSLTYIFKFLNNNLQLDQTIQLIKVD